MPSPTLQQWQRSGRSLHGVLSPTLRLELGYLARREACVVWRDARFGSRCVTMLVISSFTFHAPRYMLLRFWLAQVPPTSIVLWFSCIRTDRVMSQMTFVC